MKDSSNSSSPPSTNKPWNRTSNSSKSMEEEAALAYYQLEEDLSAFYESLESFEYQIKGDL